MGRTSRTEGTQRKAIRLSIVGGKWAEKVKKGTPRARERFSEKKQETVYEIIDDRVSGIVEEMKVNKDGKFGKEFIIYLSDNGELFELKMPVDSRYFDSFCAKFRTLDITKRIELAPYSFVPKDAKKNRKGEDQKMIGMNIYQDGVKAGYYYSKEDPKRKPQPENPDQMDGDDWKAFKIKERKFYISVIDSLNIVFKEGTAPAESNLTEEDDEPALHPTPDDDLPF